MSDRLQDIKRWLAKGERILPAELDWLIAQLEAARSASIHAAADLVKLPTVDENEVHLRRKSVVRIALKLRDMMVVETPEGGG